MERIGFFGGCFNPPTIAHMEIATKALDTCNLDKVFFIPMGNKYEKEDLIDFDLRFEMLKLCCENDSRFEILDIQKNQKDRTYAIDTFKEIKENFKNSENFFIMGMDNFIKMPKWKSYEDLRNYQYIVFKRENAYSYEANENVIFIEYNLNISSSLIRDNLKNNKSVKGLLNNKVEEYIKCKNLYS